MLFLTCRKNLRWTCWHFLIRDCCLWGELTYFSTFSPNFDKNIIEHTVHVYSILMADYRKSICRSGLPPSHTGVWTECEWIFGALLVQRLPCGFLSHCGSLLCLGGWKTVSVIYICHLHNLTTNKISYAETWPFLPISFYSPSFAKLEEWLENLMMHMEIGLSLMSELDKIRQAFWENHSQSKQTYGIPSKQTENSALGRSWDFMWSVGGCIKD